MASRAAAAIRSSSSKLLYSTTSIGASKDPFAVAGSDGLRAETPPGPGGGGGGEAAVNGPASPFPKGVTRVVPCSGLEADGGHKRLGELAAVGARVLRDGGVVALPTDTIYGLAALAQDDKAVRALYDIKGRDARKPIAISVADVEDVYKWAHVTVPRAVLESLLPGPVTVVFRRTPALNPTFNPDTDLIGLRIPDHRFVRELSREAGGPLALTSTLSLPEFSALLPRLALAFDDGGQLAKAKRRSELDRAGSTVVNLSREGSFCVIREGSAAAETRRALEGAGLEEAGDSN